MEYHFTGTGDSLDVTFIADGIIDGSGKVIPYPAIKSIKVKRKGNESVLMITAEENDTKVEYCYSVAPKDEESLKKAVADIEACYIKKRKGIIFTKLENYRHDGSDLFAGMRWWPRLVCE